MPRFISRGSQPDHPHRKRMKRKEIPGSIRFITFSCQRRLPLLRNERICSLVAHHVWAARAKHSFELFAWVFMPEHLHLLLRPKDGALLERALRSIKIPTSLRIIARWRELKTPILDKIRLADGTYRFWQKGGGFDHNVHDEHAFMRHVRYIHHNPVKRGLVEHPEDWQWSSVRWWMGQREGEFPCDPPPGVGWERWRGFK